jgi:sugar O-acyltransferase (sialic acid O-acetyltransferase NeuD family)|tara:strand:+ start:382 stop:1008 length:627 start_codon:yes stop_codon:yes gene_type:complete
MKNIIVFGAGEFGTLIQNVMSYNQDFQIAAFGDDNLDKTKITTGDVPLFNQGDLFQFAKENEIKTAIMAIGDNRVRGVKYNLFKDAGFEMLSIVHPKALIDTEVVYGDNVIIEMGTAIHTHSTIGNNVFLGGDAMIGHHNIIGNHVLVGGNVSFGGAVIVEDYVSIGVGASIKPGVRLGKGCTVGVGAAVVKDVAPGTTVVGVPAKPI